MKHILFLTILSSLLYACTDNENRIYEEYMPIAQGVWAKEDGKSFTFEIEDTAQYYHIYYMLRNTANYPYYNLYLNHLLCNEAGDTISHKLQMMHLFDEKTGKPLGNERFFSGGSMGDLFDHKFQSLIFFKFPAKGKYNFTISEYMRSDDKEELQAIEGVFSIGCRVEKAGYTK